MFTVLGVCLLSSVFFISLPIQPTEARCSQPHQYTITYPNNPGMETCEWCPKCPPGQGLAKECGSIVENGTFVGCKKCGNGTYSDGNDTSACTSCDQCGKRKTLSQCTPRQNSNCSTTSCVAGYSMNPIVDSCEPLPTTETTPNTRAESTAISLDKRITLKSLLMRNTSLKREKTIVLSTKSAETNKPVGRNKTNGTNVSTGDEKTKPHDLEPTDNSPLTSTGDSNQGTIRNSTHKLTETIVPTTKSAKTNKTVGRNETNGTNSSTGDGKTKPHDLEPTDYTPLVCTGDSNQWAIIGGVIGGIVAIVISLVILILVKFKQFPPRPPCCLEHENVERSEILILTEFEGKDHLVNKRISDEICQCYHNIKENYHNTNSATTSSTDSISSAHEESPDDNFDLQRIPEGNDTIVTLRDSLVCLEEVAALLDKETPGMKNWFHFARAFGVSKDECDNLKPKEKSSPTRSVIEHIVQVDPNLTVKKFIEVLQKMQRIDVVNEVTTTFCAKQVSDEIASRNGS